MSNVMLSIGGRTFTVACAEGEEAHIAGLGRMIEAKLEAMGDSVSRNESRMLLFAALLLADELHEARSSASVQPASAPQHQPDGLSDQLDAIATRLENLADRLESETTSA